MIEFDKQRLCWRRSESTKEDRRYVDPNAGSRVKCSDKCRWTSFRVGWRDDQPQLVGVISVLMCWTEHANEGRIPGGLVGR